MGVDSPSAITGDVLVSLGCARPDVITRLAQVIRAGAIALAAEGAKDTGTHLWTPRVGDLVVDTEADRVGEFRGGSGGRWTLARSTGGDEWTADPRHVRAPGANERVRVGMAEAVGGSDKGVG
ncbi:hypothetical protein [Kitasatospora sp. MAP5-34]|uniref:hypothetical protein n=1 Tax=Kitasatospora sp. MAP5-34 TaxID=3035102 RepID=UPI0024756879|nr:hypothetical protein [Kitasatospora sp. MAP5-34]